MLDRQALQITLPNLLRPHLARNSRRFQYGIVDFSPSHNGLGVLVDIQPFTGKVVEYSDNAMIVKTGRQQFKIIERSYLTLEPPVGSQVKVTPYTRRHFNGQRIDEPTVKVETLPNGTTYQTKTVRLGGDTTYLPVQAVNCPALKAFIEQLQLLPAPDGVRRIVHLLVDAGAYDFSLVDPLPADIFKTPPHIAFTVDNNKYQGRVAIEYERGSDTYTLKLDNQEDITDIYFDELGSQLEKAIDDGVWQKVYVEVLH